MNERLRGRLCGPAHDVQGTTSRLNGAMQACPFVVRACCARQPPGAAQGAHPRRCRHAYPRARALTDPAGAANCLGRVAPGAHSRSGGSVRSRSFTAVRSVPLRVSLTESRVVAAVEGLAKLAESREPETGDHLVRTSLYATLIAEERGARGVRGVRGVRGARGARGARRAGWDRGRPRSFAASRRCTTSARSGSRTPSCSNPVALTRCAQRSATWRGNPHGCALRVVPSVMPRRQMRAITAGSSMLAAIFSRAPHRAQRSISMPNTRFRRCAQRSATWRGSA